MSQILLTYYLPVMEETTIERAKELVDEFKLKFPEVKGVVLPSFSGREGYETVFIEDAKDIPFGTVTIPTVFGTPGTATPPLEWTYTTSDGTSTTYTSVNGDVKIVNTSNTN